MKESLRAIVEADKKARRKIENAKKKIAESGFSLSEEKKDLDSFYEKDAAEKISGLEKAHTAEISKAELSAALAIENAKKEAAIITVEKKEQLVNDLFQKIIS